MRSVCFPWIKLHERPVEALINVLWGGSSIVRTGLRSSGVTVDEECGDNAVEMVYACRGIVCEVAFWTHDAVENHIAYSLGEHGCESLPEECTVADAVVVQEAAAFRSPTAVVCFREGINDAEHVPCCDGCSHVRAGSLVSSNGRLA
jgi:hypothetical protein